MIWSINHITIVKPYFKEALNVFKHFHFGWRTPFSVLGPHAMGIERIDLVLVVGSPTTCYMDRSAKGWSLRSSDLLNAACEWASKNWRTAGRQLLGQHRNKKRRLNSTRVWKRQMCKECSYKTIHPCWPFSNKVTTLSDTAPVTCPFIPGNKVFISLSRTIVPYFCILDSAVGLSFRFG